MRLPLSTHNQRDYNGLRCHTRFGQRPLFCVLPALLSDNPNHPHQTPDIVIDHAVVWVGRLRDNNDHCYLADMRPSSQVDKPAKPRCEQTTLPPLAIIIAIPVWTSRTNYGIFKGKRTNGGEGNLPFP